MSDEADFRDRQARHTEDNRKAAGSPASREIVRREIESALRELGINLAEWEGVREFRETIDFAREMRRKSREIGTESRKGMVAALWAALAAAVSGAAAAWVALKSGGHS